MENKKESKDRFLNKFGKVHIGNDLWLIGNIKRLSNGDLHRVIYAPDKKQYHLYNDAAQSLNESGEDQYGQRYNRHRVDCAKAKIYILTNILDSKENWEFDLTKIPQNGKLKVIYANGTVRNVNFDGFFESIELVLLKEMTIYDGQVDLNDWAWREASTKNNADSFAHYKRTICKYPISYTIYSVRNEETKHAEELKCLEHLKDIKSKFPSAKLHEVYYRDCAIGGSVVAYRKY